MELQLTRTNADTRFWQAIGDAYFEHQAHWKKPGLAILQMRPPRYGLGGAEYPKMPARDGDRENLTPADNS